MLCQVKQTVSGMSASYEIISDAEQIDSAEMPNNFLFGTPCDIFFRDMGFRSHSPSIRLTNHYIHIGRMPADLYRSVAQLGRATVSKTVCCRFDSCPACHFASKQLNTNMPVWRKQADAGNLKFLVYTACGFKSRYRHHIMHRTLVGRA